MRKLCYICEATQGGVRKHLGQLIRLFVKPEEDFSVHAILGDRGEPGFREELAQLAAAHGNFQYVFVPQLRRAISPLRDIRAYARIKEQLRAINPDIVHTHSSKAGMLGREAARQLGVKYIFHTPHVFPFQWSSGLLGRIYLGLERRAARGCRAIVCVGAGQRAEALARGAAPGEKLVVIRNGIELPAPATDDKRAALRASLKLPDGAAVVGMVARLAPQKGVGIFVKAAAQMLARQPHLICLLIGGGPLEEEVRSRAAELSLPPERFRLLGHRPDAETLYPVFDALVLSSLYEGLPYVLLEAMAWGVPVVATDVLGSRDAVADGVTGLLAPTNDPEAIARQTLRLLNEPDLRRSLSANARRRVAEEFSFEAFAQGHRKLYQAE